VPFLEHVVFLSAPRIEPRLDAATATRVFCMGRPGGPQDQGIISVLSGGLPSAGYTASVDAPIARVISRAMEEAGVRPALGQRRIGDYELGKILDEGEGWQDWDGVHVSAKVHRRIRIYPFASSSSDESRKSLGRLAAREFQVMEGIDHPGILKVRDFKESERGPALVFDHDPKAKRLDFLLREHLDLMGVELRLHFVRQLAETLKYAHGKRLYHRTLSPQSILVRDPDQAYPNLQIMNWQSAARDASTGGTSLGTRGTEHLEDYVEDLAKVYIAPEALHGGVETGAHHDVFSLGAIAFHLFAGQPPAATPLDLVTKLRTDGGLRISDMIDGAMQSLVDLIRLSTHPDVSNRIGSMEESTPTSTSRRTPCGNSRRSSRRQSTATVGPGSISRSTAASTAVAPGRATGPHSSTRPCPRRPREPSGSSDCGRIWPAPTNSATPPSPGSSRRSRRPWSSPSASGSDQRSATSPTPRRRSACPRRTSTWYARASRSTGSHPSSTPRRSNSD
jgi:serine/threonine protein kinase